MQTSCPISCIFNIGYSLFQKASKTRSRTQDNISGLQKSCLKRGKNKVDEKVLFVNLIRIILNITAWKVSK